MSTDLAVIEAALAAATPGPWWAEDGDTESYVVAECVRPHPITGEPMQDRDCIADTNPDDARAIATFRNAAAELVERVKAAEAEVERATWAEGSIRAELDAAEATIARVRELAEQHPGTAWNSGLNLRQALRDALGGTPTDAPEGAELADEERNRFSGENTAGARKPIGCSCRTCNPDSRRMIVCATCGNKRCPHASNHVYQCTWSNEPDQKPILRPTDQRYEPPAVDDESGCCR